MYDYEFDISSSNDDLEAIELVYSEDNFKSPLIAKSVGLKVLKSLFNDGKYILEVNKKCIGQRKITIPPRNGVWYGNAIFREDNCMVFTKLNDTDKVSYKFEDFIYFENIHLIESNNGSIKILK